MQTAIERQRVIDEITRKNRKLATDGWIGFRGEPILVHFPSRDGEIMVTGPYCKKLFDVIDLYRDRFDVYAPGPDGPDLILYSRHRDAVVPPLELGVEADRAAMFWLSIAVTAAVLWLWLLQ